jgi:hypothetical protein
LGAAGVAVIAGVAGAAGAGGAGVMPGSLAGGTGGGFPGLLLVGSVMAISLSRDKSLTTLKA